MSDAKKVDVWLRGPVEGVPGLLMPAAHAFLHAAEDVSRWAPELSAESLWERPGGAASPGFHLRHLAGSTGRLLGYARGMGLSEAQRAAYAREGEVGGPEESVEVLAAGAVEAFHRAVDELRATAESTLLDPIEIGAARLPSTVLGAIFHAAEHAQRHVGQFVTTVKVLQDRAGGS